MNIRRFIYRYFGWAEKRRLRKQADERMAAILAGVQRTCYNCGGPVNTSSGYIICERGCGGPVTQDEYQRKRCTCLYTKSGDDMSLDPACPVHNTPLRTTKRNR